MHTNNIHGSKKVQQHQPGTEFKVAQAMVPCPYKFMFYVDYGSTDMGPWLKVGINGTEHGIGYLPAQVKPTVVETQAS